MNIRDMKRIKDTRFRRELGTRRHGRRMYEDKAEQMIDIALSEITKEYYPCLSEFIGNRAVSSNYELSLLIYDSDNDNSDESLSNIPDPIRAFNIYKYQNYAPLSINYSDASLTEYTNDVQFHNKYGY